MPPPFCLKPLKESNVRSETTSHKQDSARVARFRSHSQAELETRSGGDSHARASRERTKKIGSSNQKAQRVRPLRDSRRAGVLRPGLR